MIYYTPTDTKYAPIYQSAWEDAQRAVRLVRAAAARRGYDPERIGVIGMSAGGHLAALLATRGLTNACDPVDELDRTIPCHVNFAIVCALPYALSDGLVDQNAFGGNPRYAALDALLTPDAATNQCASEIKWFIPSKLKTKAIQIIYSGGGYGGNNPDSTWDGTRAARRFLNAKGMAVVALRYRTPRPVCKPKHLSAWQDLQRAVRVVRSSSTQYGLDGEKIGLLGGSTGGHLAIIGATSSLSPAYAPIDKTDKLSCSVQWAIACYPAYVLTDGADGCNRHGGNDDSERLVDDFAFDRATPPMLFLHGDADGYSAMGSALCWTRLREIGIQSTLHTYIKRGHCFMVDAAPAIGSYAWLNRVWDFLVQKKIASQRPLNRVTLGLCPAPKI